MKQAFDSLRERFKPKYKKIGETTKTGYMFDEGFNIWTARQEDIFNSDEGMKMSGTQYVGDFPEQGEDDIIRNLEDRMASDLSGNMQDIKIPEPELPPSGLGVGRDETNTNSVNVIPSAGVPVPYAFNGDPSNPHGSNPLPLGLKPLDLTDDRKEPKLSITQQLDKALHLIEILQKDSQMIRELNNKLEVRIEQLEKYVG